MEPNHFRIFLTAYSGLSFFAIRFGYTRFTSTSFFAGGLALGEVVVFFIEVRFYLVSALLLRPRVDLMVSVTLIAD